MTQEEILSGFILELRRGTIVLSVLSQLHTPTYGYNLITTLAQHGVTVEANTLYPLLRRLEGQGLLSSNWETTGSKPRKYYVLTATGNEILHSLTHHWAKTVQNVDALLQQPQPTPTDKEAPHE